MINPLPARAKARVLFSTRRLFLSICNLALGIAVLAPIFVNAGEGGDIISNEIARRQKLADDARLAIIEGDDLVDQRDFSAATLKYYAAYSTTDDSPLAADIHNLARERFASFSVVHARQLAEVARYKEANQVLDRVLDPEVAPNHRAASTFKLHLADPERFNPALTPEHIKKVSKVEKLFQEAEGHIRIGNFDLAKLKYAEILSEDQYNEAARRGMSAAALHIANYHDSARSHFRAKALSDVDKLWEFQVPLSQRAYQVAANLPGTQSMSQAISDRLRNIIVPEIEFTDESLPGVAQYLSRISKQLDPTGVGINFVIDLNQADAALRDVSVNLILRSVPLADVLRFVTDSTGTKYSVEQNAVVITSLNSLSTVMITKSFYVPPDFFNSAPEAGDGGGNDNPFGEGGGSNQTGITTLRLDAKTYLQRSGVPFPEKAFASHSAATNTLVVRNTQSNIDLIEALVDSSTKDLKKMVRVSVTMYEIDVTNSIEKTFDHLLGQFNLPGSKSSFGSGAGLDGSTSDFAFAPPGSDVPVGQNSLSSGIRSGSMAIRANPINAVADGDPVSNAGSARAPATFAISGVFSDPQWQTAIRLINQNKNVTVANQPSTLTRPGQRAVIEILRDFPYPTEYDPPEIPQTFNQGGGGNILIDPVNQVITLIPGADPPTSFPVTPAHPSAFDVRKVGTRMEVEPTIDANGYLVTLNLSIEFSQFEGFINYGTPITTTDGVTLTDNRILQPLFKVSRLTQPVHVHDGANFVIGGIMNDDVQMTEDKTPFLGDIPLVGRMFRGEVSERRRKAVMFFVNVRVLDASGEPINRELSPEDQ